MEDVFNRQRQQPLFHEAKHFSGPYGAPLLAPPRNRLRFSLKSYEPLRQKILCLGRFDSLGCAMKYLENTPHLDPLPSSDEGRGNPVVGFWRTLQAQPRLPLPFGRGEDQGEGLLRKTLISLNSTFSSRHETC